MKIEHLLNIIKARGFEIAINGNGQPILRGNKDEATEVLMEAISAHRKDILNALGYGIKESNAADAEQQYECLWPGTNFIGRHWYPEHGWPVGAYFYRNVGTEEWLPIPGRAWNQETRRGTITAITKPREVLQV